MTSKTDDPGLHRGSLGIGKDGSFQIHFERHFPFSPSVVWQWLVDPDKLSKWLPGSTISPLVGGQVLYDFGDEVQATGDVISLQAPTTGAGHLEHSWNWDGVPTPSIVKWEIQPTADGSRLSLNHREVPREPAREFGMGWHMILDSLQLAVSGSAVDEAWNLDEETIAYYVNQD